MPKPGDAEKVSRKKSSYQQTAFQLRGNSFPTQLKGKAYDTGLVCSWLEDDLCHVASQAWGTHVCYIDASNLSGR